MSAISQNYATMDIQRDREKPRAVQMPKNPIKTEDFASIEVLRKFKLSNTWR
jgi:hypothetical protein